MIGGWGMWIERDTQAIQRHCFEPSSVFGMGLDLSASRCRRRSMVRQAVRDLESLGRFANSESAEDDRVRRHEEVLMRIGAPVSDEEARVLVRLFGTDDYYGLAWVLLHLIETTPGWPLEDCIASMDPGEWQQRLRERARRLAR